MAAHSRSPHLRRAHAWMTAVFVGAFAGLPAPALAQVGSLVSPGLLSQAHASLEGASNCEKCHEPGRKVAAERCLQCHRPIAQRIAARKGVHRNVRGDCVACHVEHAGRDAELRPFDTRSFDHATETGFPLDGRHAPLARTCARCHKTRSFLGVSPSCSGCHQDPHKGSLGPQCARCHSTSVPFKQVSAGFDHSRTAFPLVGAHRTVACARCHPAGTFAGLKFQQCVDCHKTPHRQPLADACVVCHTQETWRTQKIDHARTGFPLRGRHQSVPCAKCHLQPATRVRLKAERCADCHADPHRGAFKQDCAGCHQETGFARGTFNHNLTGFPLTGRHATIACVSCHKNASGAVVGARVAPGALAPTGGGLRPSTSRVVDFRGLSRACSSCHADVHKGEAGSACQSCHSTASFKVARYNHARFPDFFAGQHATVTCAGCHGRGAPAVQRTGATPPTPTLAFKNISTACASCHQDVHLGQVSSACESCHTVAGARFAPVSFEHDRSRFPLTGRHRTLECRSCHKRESAAFPAGTGTAVRLKGLATACAGCHTDVHLGQLGNACEGCHTTEAARYAPVRFTHDRSTFPLTGRHRDTPCASCHKRETATFPSGPGTAVRFRGMKATCQSCHKDPHLGQIQAGCETCHQTTTFHVTSYVHKRTPELFAGKHATLPCARCHKQEQAVFPAGAGLAVRYTGMGDDCAPCHADPHRGGFGATCRSCHRPTGWQSVSRGFHQLTQFPLEGRHLTTECASCHVNGVTRGTPRACYDCHWIRRQDDRYQTRLGSQCEQCHRPTSWTAVRWDHGTTTGFPLSPVHRGLGCESCHREQRFQNAPMNCYQCHEQDYRRAVNPNHVTAGFPTSCDACHKSSHSAWRQAVFSHSGFPLVGVHATQPCAACHKNNLYRGTPSACFGCHKADYDGTQNPNHKAAGYPTTCESCHRASDATWRGGFNHASVFPLVGPHATLACNGCHKNNVYAGTPRTCFGCHQADYQRTANPNHVAAQFPTTCDTCHRATDSSWQQGRFTHTWFPTNHGTAAGQCSACHQNPSDYRTFSCLTCHERGRTDSQHQGRSGYRYDSAACYSCHPTGRGAPAPLAWRPDGGRPWPAHDVRRRFPAEHRLFPCHG